MAIPTHRRPDGLRAALDSLEHVKRPPGAVVEVLVVENDRQKTVDDVIAGFTGLAVHYVLEGSPRCFRLVHSGSLRDPSAIPLDADGFSSVCAELSSNGLSLPACSR